MHNIFPVSPLVTMRKNTKLDLLNLEKFVPNISGDKTEKVECEIDLEETHTCMLDNTERNTRNENF